MRLEGWRRLAIIASVAWFVGYYLYASSDINLWAHWAFSSWRTTCADVFGEAHGLVSTCGLYEDSFAAWWKVEGPSVMVFVWWFGPIAALWCAFQLTPWVVAGFKQG